MIRPLKSSRTYSAEHFRATVSLRLCAPLLRDLASFNFHASHVRKIQKGAKINWKKVIQTVTVLIREKIFIRLRLFIHQSFIISRLLQIKTFKVEITFWAQRRFSYHIFWSEIYQYLDKSSLFKTKTSSLVRSSKNGWHWYYQAHLLQNVKGILNNVEFI